MTREGNMVDLPCRVCQKLVTVTVKNAVERGVPMAIIRAGQMYVTDWAMLDGQVHDPIDLPPCREHSGLF